MAWTRLKTFRAIQTPLFTRNFPFWGTGYPTVKLALTISFARRRKFYLSAVFYWRVAVGKTRRFLRT